MTPADLNRTLAEVRRAVPAVSGLQLGERGRVVGRYFGASITTAFQPWRAPEGDRIVAVEAYARSHSKQGEGLSPWQLFAGAAVDHDLVTLDRLSRTVHTLNFIAGGARHAPLVLNVDARLLHAVAGQHGRFFGKVLELAELPPRQVVIEVCTSQLFDLSRLRQIVASYRGYGFLVAVNAEGALHARSLMDFLAPDILMLDAGTLSPEGLARHAGSLAGGRVAVAVKRIETPAHLEAAREGGADWVQGFLFDQPSPELPAP